uniref:Uncharacterized protein n=1 Tax=Parascaris univalens TaxID=6257 RepID=A0A915ACA6_PARUN
IISLYDASIFFILFTHTLGGLTINQSHAENRNRMSHNNETNLDSTFSNIQSHKMPIEILEPDLARRIFVGANNPLMRTTIRNSPRVTLKPNVRLRRATELPSSKPTTLMLSSVTAGITKRSVEAELKKSFESAENDDISDVAVDYISTEDTDSYPNITHLNDIADMPMSNDIGENISQILISQTIQQEINTTTITTESPIASLSHSTQIMPTTDAESGSTSEKGILTEGNVVFSKVPQSSVGLPEFTDDSTRPTMVAKSTLETGNFEDTVRTMEEDLLKLPTVQPTLDVMTMVAIPIQNTLLNGGDITLQTTTTDDLKATEVTPASTEQQTSTDVSIPLNSNRSTGDPEDALLHQIKEDGKFVLSTLPQQNILVIGNEVRTMDPVETPSETRFFTFWYRDKRRRVKIEPTYLLNDQFFGPDPLKTKRTVISGSTSWNSYKVENDFARTKRDAKLPLVSSSSHRLAKFPFDI